MRPTIPLIAIGLLFGCSDDTVTMPPDASPDTVQRDVSSPDQTPQDASPAVDVGTHVDVGTTDVAASDTFSQGAVTGVLRFWTTYGPAADVDICVYQNGKKTTQCTKTTKNGEYSIVVDANVELALLLEGPGLEKVAFPVKLEEPTLDIGTFLLLTDAEAAALYATAGVPYPLTLTGSVIITARSGAQVTVVPPTGMGPFYLTYGPGALVFDKTLTEMDWGGTAQIFGLLPGIYDIQVTHPTASCISMAGWPPTTTALRGPVIAGYATSLGAYCL